MTVRWVTFGRAMRTGIHRGRVGRVAVVAVAMIMLSTTAAFASSSSSSAAYLAAANLVDLPLQIGDTGSDVSTLQGMLKNAGFDPGPIDGAFGRLTEQAVVALQRANGLELNGRVSQTEWDLLLGGLLMQSGQRGDDVRNCRHDGGLVEHEVFPAAHLGDFAFDVQERIVVPVVLSSDVDELKELIPTIQLGCRVNPGNGP